MDTPGTDTRTRQDGWRGARHGLGKMTPCSWPDVVKVGILLAVYVSTAKLGLMLDAVSGFATAVWPPAGIALVALSWGGYRLWPGIAVGAFLVNVSAGAPPLAAVGMALGNTLEALVGTCLLRRVVGFRPTLERLQDVSGLVVLAAGLSTLISATMGVTSGWLGGVIPTMNYGKAWWTWWLGDMAGDLVVAPLVWIWGGSPRLPLASWRVAEGGAVLGAVAAISMLVFHGSLAMKALALPCTLFLPLIWAALRFGQRGAVTATAVASAIAIWGTAKGLGPFAWETLGESLLVLQAFTSIAAVTILVLAAALTERKRVEADVRRLNETLEQHVAERTAALEETVADLEAFTYSVSHDLRAPLRAMQGFTQALLEDYTTQLDPVGQDYAHRIGVAAARMETLIQDLLAYSRLSRAELPLRPVALAAVVAEVLAHLEVAIQTREARVTVEEPLPAVLGHHITLRQVVTNLLTNAVTFVAPGVPPRVRIWAEAREAWVRLWLEDNGIGIAREHQDHIFRMFERLHGLDTYPGTGIGLAIVRKGMERMGGEVGVESAVGQGSRFWVELPHAENQP